MPASLGLLNILHIFNDGYQASFLLLLPFIAKDLHISLTQIGSLGSFFYLFETILAIPVGYAGEKLNGFKIVLFSALLVAASFMGLSFINSYTQLILLFMLAGIGFALFHPMAFALVAGWSSKVNRGKSLGDFTAVGDVGRIALPAIMTFLAGYAGWRKTSFLYAGAVFALFVTIIFVSRKLGKLIPADNKSTRTIKMLDLLKNRRFILACITALLDSASSSSLFIFLPFLLVQKGINPAVLGSFTAAYFVGNFFGKSLIGRMTDKIGGVKTFIISEILMGVFIILLTNASSLPLIIIYSILLGFLTKGTVPARASMAIEAVEHNGRYEKAIALLGLIASFGTAGAPLLYGKIADSYGIMSSFYVSAFIAMLAIIPALGFKYVHPSTK